MALARAALSEAAEARERAREGLLGHYTREAASRLIDTTSLRPPHDPAAEGA